MLDLCYLRQNNLIDAEFHVRRVICYLIFLLNFQNRISSTILLQLLIVNFLSQETLDPIY